MRTTFTICTVFATLFLSASVAPAEEGIIKPAFGFDLSFNYALPNDHRFTGSTVGFELSLLEIADDVRFGFYHEQGHWHGSDGDESVRARSNFTAIHFDYQIFSGDGQAVSLFTNAGHIVFHEGISKSAFAADLGVHYDPLILTARGVTTNFGITLCYRYSHIESTEVFGSGSRLVNDASGFLAGVHGLIRF